MNKFRDLLILSVFVCCLTACKKDDKPKISSALVGKWYIRTYTATTSVNGVASAPYITPFSDTARNIYYEFKKDGIGEYQANTDPAFILIPPTGFRYQVSGSNITFSNNSDFLNAQTCSYTMPSNNSLIIRAEYDYKQGTDGVTVNAVQTLNFSK